MSTDQKNHTLTPEATPVDEKNNVGEPNEKSEIEQAQEDAAKERAKQGGYQ